MIVQDNCKDIGNLIRSPLFKGDPSHIKIIADSEYINYLNQLEGSNFPEDIPEGYYKTLWELAEKGNALQEAYLKENPDKSEPEFGWIIRTCQELVTDLGYILEKPESNSDDLDPYLDYLTTPKIIGRSSRGDITHVANEKGSGAIMVKIGRNDNPIDLGSLLKMSHDDIEIFND